MMPTLQEIRQTAADDAAALQAEAEKLAGKQADVERRRQQVQDAATAEAAEAAYQRRKAETEHVAVYHTAANQAFDLFAQRRREIDTERRAETDPSKLRDLAVEIALLEHGARVMDYWRRTAGGGSPAQRKADLARLKEERDRTASIGRRVKQALGIA